MRRPDSVSGTRPEKTAAASGAGPRAGGAARGRAIRDAQSLFGGRASSRSALEDGRGKERGKTPRFRPVLLSKIIGRRPLTPPARGLNPPAALAGLDSLRPARDPSGAAVPAAPADVAAVEEIDPSAIVRDRRAAAHWDGGLWHAGAAHGEAKGAGWAWLYRDGPRWWAVADGGTVLLRHEGVWWTRLDGVWFVVHEGRPWALRQFREWDAQGLFQPATGAQMVYSRDYSRVAVIAPGEGAEVFDAATGELLEKIPESGLPSRGKPRIPAARDLPSDVFAAPPGR